LEGVDCSDVLVNMATKFVTSCTSTPPAIR
jgi:hypothetical protein